MTSISDSVVRSHAEAVKVSRMFDWMILFTLFFVVLGGYHIHYMVIAGDWDFWSDWKDRRLWVTVAPIVSITFPAAVQAVLWGRYKLPFGAVACVLGLLLGEWINRYLNFWGWTYFPINFCFPSNLIPGAIVLDVVLMLTNSIILTAIMGGMAWGLLFYPSNWSIIAPLHVPVEYNGMMMTLADLQGYHYIRTGTPEYIRMVEEGTLRTFGKDVAPVSAFFSGFVSIFIYYLWHFFGNWFGSTAFVYDGIDSFECFDFEDFEIFSDSDNSESKFKSEFDSDPWLPEPLSSADTDIKAIHKAYPDIKSSNEHPIVGESIDLEVILGDDSSSTTGGIVILPDEVSPEFVFEIRVHLLCANTSEWETLKYSKAEGTIKSAIFKIKVPKITPDIKGDYPDSEKLLVRANFYYENRWCGEGRRFLDLLINEKVKRLYEIPKPPESEWQKCINIERGAQPPDLLVRIQSQEDGGNKYLWTFLSPYLEFTGNSKASMEIPNGEEVLVKNLYEPYASVTLTNVKLADIEGTGKHIYDSTPKAFKEAYLKVFNQVKQLNKEFDSILFISDESCVPWELMWIANEGVPPEFLGIRHAVGRWIASESSYLVQNINVQEFVVTGSDYTKIHKIGNLPKPKELPWVKDELDWLIQHYKSQPITLNSATILQLLEEGTAQAVHFACHGQKSHQNSLKNELIMEDYSENITSSTINRTAVQKGLGAQHPIIFLNACQAAASGNELGLIVGLPAAFLAAGASAVICPLWRISDAHAKEITKQFYLAAFAQPNKTLGKILQTIRTQWKNERHLTFLAYVLYGDPQAQIKFTPYLRRDQYGLYTDLIIKDITQRFRWIEPGNFLMGSPESEKERFDREVLHQVTLTQGFWLADTTVTQALWQVVMGTNPSVFRDDVNNPVESVSWDDAQAFIDKVNTLIPDLKAKLPTEAQWEYACRAGTTTRFSFGDKITPEQVRYAEINEDFDGKATIPVKSLPANPWGLYEMHGNVWEWCQDYWFDQLHDEPVIDPIQQNESTKRVIRGGSWFREDQYARSAFRVGYNVDSRDYDIGFRLVLGLDVWSQQAPITNPSEYEPEVEQQKPENTR